MLFRKYILLQLLFILLAYVSSCTDNPVSNNSQTFDTVDTYDWKADTVRGYYLTSFDVVDTNNIYFTANPTSSILHYDGNNYSPIDLQDPLFRGAVIKAWDKNNIYVCGARIGGSWLPAVLKMVRNGTVYSYEVPDDSTVTIQSICLIDENHAWLGCSENNIVYYFDNGTFTKFQFSENERDNYFLKYQNNDIYLFSLKYVYSGKDNNEIILFIRKFENDNFVIAKIDSTFGSSGKSRNFQNSTNGDIVFSGLNSIFSFENRNIVTMYSSNLINFGTAIGGPSKNDLIIDKLHSSDFPERNAYLWKDDKIMIEKNLRFDSYSNVSIIAVLNNKVFITTSSGFLPSTFIIGMKK